MAHATYRSEGDYAKALRKRAGAYLQGLRKDARYTQAELAHKLGYEYFTFVSQIENGTARVPPKDIPQWANALGVDTHEMAETLLGFYDPHMHAALFGGRRK